MLSWSSLPLKQPYPYNPCTQTMTPLRLKPKPEAPRSQQTNVLLNRRSPKGILQLYLPIGGGAHSSFFGENSITTTACKKSCIP